MNNRVLVTLALAMLLGGGCATVAMSPEATDTAAKTFTPDPTVSVLYIVRPGRLATAVLLPVLVDGRNVGALAPRTYLRIPVPRGSHAIAVQTMENQEVTMIEALPGTVEFYRVRPEVGLVDMRIGLDRLLPGEGMKAVRHSQLAVGVPAAMPTETASVITDPRIESIRLGMTAAEVKRILGAPAFGRSRPTGHGGERWDFETGPGHWSKITIENGVVVDLEP